MSLQGRGAGIRAGGMWVVSVPVRDGSTAGGPGDLCQLACYDLRDEWQIAESLIDRSVWRSRLIVSDHI